MNETKYHMSFSQRMCNFLSLWYPPRWNIFHRHNALVLSSRQIYDQDIYTSLPLCHVTVGPGVPTVSHISLNLSPSVYCDFTFAIRSRCRNWGFIAVKCDKKKMSEIKVGWNRCFRSGNNAELNRQNYSSGAWNSLITSRWPAIHR